MSQREHSQANLRAWAHKYQEATLQLGGSPEELAATLRANPAYTLRDYLEFLGDVNGKKIANLLGSSGKKAVALALLGARVTVVDINPENQAYARACAAAAGVSIDYIVADVVEWDIESVKGQFDLVLMELGILHYFVDLPPLAQRIADLLAPGGQYVLHEAHPFMNKCAPRQDGDQLVLEGDYFSTAVVEKPAPRQGLAFSPEEVAELPQGRYRYWTLGETVSAIAATGLVVKTLVETPHRAIAALPGTFTLVAQK